MKLYHWTRSKLGVTFTEIIIAMATSGILLAAIVSSFVSQQKSYVVQTQIADMTVNARTALDRLTRDIRIAGYGLSEEDWVDWIDWVRGPNGAPLRFSSPVQIISNDLKPDELILIGAFDRPIAHVRYSRRPSVNKTELRLNYESGVSRLNTDKRKLIYFGRNELALVTATRGRRIYIDTNIDEPGNQGVAWDYTKSDKDFLPSVELISVLTYKIVIDSRNYAVPTPVLKRDTNTGGGAQPLAEYIEDLQFTLQDDDDPDNDPDFVTIQITARTANPDPNYTHPRHKDHYRRLTLTSQVKLRGLQY